MRSVWFILAALMIAGCNRPQEHIDPPQVVGERKTSTGETTDRFIRQVRYSSRDVLLTPEGPRKSLHYDTRYFLQHGDEPSCELKFLQNTKMLFGDELSHCGKFGGVVNSPLWVGAGIDTVDYILHLVVFDNEHVITHQTFKVLGKYITSEDEFTFTNGYRTVIFRAPEGRKEYSVTEGKVLEVQQNDDAKK
jgi:hypothetical protein